MVYPILVVVCGQTVQGKTGIPMKNIIRIMLKIGFICLERNLTEMVRESGKVFVWGIVVSILEMDEN